MLIEPNFSEAVFIEKRRVAGPILELTVISPYLIVDAENQLSNPTTMNADERMFPPLFKNGTTNRKKESARKKERSDWSGLYVLEYRCILWSMC